MTHGQKNIKIFYKLSGGEKTTFPAPKYAALFKVYFMFLKQEVNLNQGYTNHEIPVARQKSVYGTAYNLRVLSTCPAPGIVMWILDVFF